MRIKGTKRGAKIQHCGSCGETLPLYSRLCPYCLYSKYYSAEALCHLDPLPYLNIMRCYVDELLEMAEPDIVGRRNEVREREIKASFDTAESVLSSAFCTNREVMEAGEVMEQIIEGELSRRRAVTRRRRVVIVVVVLVVISIVLLII